MHNLTFWAQTIHLESIEHVYKRILKYQTYKQLDSWTSDPRVKPHWR